MKIIPLSLLLTELGVTAMAQQAFSWINQDVTKSYPNVWKPDYNAGKRYVIGIQPYNMLHFGLKLDFEMELDKPGKYLQFGLMGYYAPYNKDSYYYENSEYFLGDGWQIFGGDSFDNPRGDARCLGLKQHFGPRGWFYVGF